MTASDAPTLAGVHCLKLPVTDLARSLDCCRSRLGDEVELEFPERDLLMGYALVHPRGDQLRRLSCPTGRSTGARRRPSPAPTAAGA